MKIHFPLVFMIANLAAITAARATIVFSGSPTLAIPLDFDGFYFNPFSGVTAFSQPATWTTQPWINPFFGGLYIGYSGQLLPLITGTDQIVNVPVGTLIGGGGSFAPGQGGSSTHTGADPGKFVLGMPGYIGFAMKTAPTAATQYGWIEIEIQNTGPGSILRWAYEDTPGTPLQAGAVPEPATTVLTLTGSAALALRRRRHVDEDKPAPSPIRSTEGRKSKGK